MDSEISAIFSNFILWLVDNNSDQSLSRGYIVWIFPQLLPTRLPPFREEMKISRIENMDT